MRLKKDAPKASSVKFGFDTGPFELRGKATVVVPQVKKD